MDLPNLHDMRTYDPEISRLLARLCDLSYTEKFFADDNIKLHGTDTDVEFLEIFTDTQLFIVFRGTEFTGPNASLNDIKTNIDFCWHAFDEEFLTAGEVHQGFLIAFNKALPDLIEIINKHRHKKINLIGHSLGGAFCILAGAWINYKLNDAHVNSVWTFGAPRVGDSKFKKFYNEGMGLEYKTFRVVYDSDAATKVPPWIIGYRHVGTEIWLDHLGNSHIGMPWYKAFGSKISLNALWDDSRKDHDIENYYLIYPNRQEDEK